jgi:predicted acylesterase/phospholipase RssA
MEKAGAERVWQNFSGRIAAVLSGGGARGAYEAGALLAFQDAQLPTHILTATSVGSINAGSYASHSDTQVGNAESLVETWFGLIPPAVGIEWTSYVWRLAGLVAASAGFGNLIGHFLVPEGLAVHLHDPALTWLALGLAGTAVLLLYDYLPYLGYVVRGYFRGTTWKPEGRKAALSIVANVVVLGFLILAFHSLHVVAELAKLIRFHPVLAAAVAMALAMLVKLRRRWSARFSIWVHKVLRLLLRSGLFSNFERSRLLRERISPEGLRASPIRVIFTATDLETGAARFFSNTPPERLRADRGADPRFVAEEVTTADDLIRAVVASSALPIVYEPLTVGGRLYSDGGIVTNQPIRPAIRLGAEVLFLIMVHAPESQRGKAETFLDLGLRGLDILMEQSLLTDLKLLNSVNALCERAAAELRLRPEEIEIDFGTRRYRYAKAFIIRPAAPLPGSALDFGGETTGPAILQGYQDACAQIESFLGYAPQAKFGQPRHLLRYSMERGSSRGS